VDESLWNGLRRRFKVQLSFGIFTERWNRGFELSAGAIERIKSLGAGVEFDIYADREGDDEQLGAGR
jgi:hypothetical protein